MGRCSKRATGQACKPSSFGRGKKLTRESACHGNHGEEDERTHRKHLGRCPLVNSRKSLEVCGTRRTAFPGNLGPPRSLASLRRTFPFDLLVNSSHFPDPLLSLTRSLEIAEVVAEIEALVSDGIVDSEGAFRFRTQGQFPCHFSRCEREDFASETPLLTM